MWGSWMGDYEEILDPEYHKAKMEFTELVLIVFGLGRNK